ncbi:hypothetical protein Godav_002390 [Gossypium davidsonii]|uniref:RNase H type-1 domain-containing protein n=2 Tax=Gossypium TaxID=3633 RepID=A0A7J8SWR5_GOSDV|nr:hypothetical protein [Gossypium davidsonii]MBA0665987.1 hypothetical protein [Gossypium klotzschianum]
MGFTSFLGERSTFDAELWGILDGLTLILDSSLVGVMIQTDRPWAIQRIPKELNNDADYIVKLAFDTR